MEFAGSHILSVEQFGRADIERVFDVADSMAPYAHRRKITRVLEGAILGNMFFEPSTRTRVSFGCAFNLLGGEVRETTGIENSAIAKGESLYDTARVISGYSDVIAMRHPVAGSGPHGRRLDCRVRLCRRSLPQRPWRRRRGRLRVVPA